MSSENFAPLESTVFFLVIPLAILCLFSFFLPLGSIHSAMLRAKTRLQVELDQISQEIHHLGSNLLTKAEKLDPEQGKVLEEKMEFLKRVYARHSQIPTWPYRNAHLRGLISTQIVPTIGVISTVVNFVRDFGK